MAYTKQTWTAPTGTGLSRYAKSAESASHVTLTLDPENLTNTPTPFTMARMAHMEDGIAKAYDTAPPTPWAQYSGKDIPQLPDNVAGTTYKRDNDWTNTDGWIPNHASTVLSVENSMLKMAYDGTRTNTGLSIQKTGLTYNNKLIVGKIKSTVPIISVGYYNGTVVTPLKLNETNSYETVFYGYSTSVFPALILYMNVGQLTAKTCWLESLYIGTGSYDRLVFDNSYHYRHLLNNAVVPTPQGLYFNGATSYLRSKDKVTLPVVMPFHAIINCAVKTTAQTFFYAEEGDAIIAIYRKLSSVDLMLDYYNTNTSAVVSLVIGTGFFTGLDNTDVETIVKIDFTAKTVTSYKEGTQIESISIPYILKPASTYIYYGYKSGVGLLGYMRNIYLFDTSLTDTQRNWLAQGNTPPILYDVTNYELEQGFAQVTEGVETIRRDEDFTMNTYADGKKLRIANTDDVQITCTLPTGQTMNGQTSFTIAPDTLLEFELIGTAWKCISNVRELIWINPSPESAYTPSAPETTSGQIEQFKSLIFTFSSLAPNTTYQHSMEVILTPTISATNLFVGHTVVPRTRQVNNFSGNSVQFSSGDAGGTTNQNVCVPLAIYGVK